LSTKYVVAGKTDVGLVRSGNEDCYKIDIDHDLFMVCDGMGGHLAGDVASSEACEVINHCFAGAAEEISADSTLALGADLPPRGDLLIRAIRIANRSIYMKSRSRDDYSGMGTTIAAGVLEDDLLHIAHVGDSRVYRLEEKGLVRLTTDHSWVSELEQTGAISESEAANFPSKNVITRALGVRETVEIDYRANKIGEGEIYIFCSDGLCGYADDDEIFSVAKDCGNDVELMTENLVQLANDHGGQDNVTVVALRIDKIDRKSKLENISPVTVPAEEDEAIYRENEIIEAILELRKSSAEEEPPVEEESRSVSLWPLLLIFIAFVIVAAIIYFSVIK
jgi:protein phosphatase